MRENFAFEIGATTITFESIKSSFGMQFKGMNDSGLISWDIATSKNPYQNGLQVNNRTANAREITVEFEFENADVIAAQTNFENAIASALNGHTLTIKKTVGSLVKRIDGVIQAAGVANIFTDNGEKPIYQLTLLTDSFWRGIAEETQLSIDIDEYNYAFYGSMTVKGEINPEKAALKLTVKDNPTEMQQPVECRLYVYNTNTRIGRTLIFEYAFPKIAPGEDVTELDIEITLAPTFDITAYAYGLTDSKQSLLSTVLIAEFPQFEVGIRNNLKFSLIDDAGTIINPDKEADNKFVVEYTPLYIR